MTEVPPPPREGRAASSSPEGLARLGAPFLGLVSVEFLLGMALNLFGSLPVGSPVSMMEASPILDLHILFGVLLLGIASSALRLSAAARLRPAMVITGMGFASALAAFGAGAAFAFGSQSPWASYAMSIGFVGLLVEAGYLLTLRHAYSAAGYARNSAPYEA